MFEGLRNRLLGKAAPPVPKKGAAPTGGGGQLPPVNPPKVKPNQQTYPDWITTTRIPDSVIQKVDPNLANTEISSTYRLGTTTNEVIRNLARAHPDLSAAVSAYLRVGIPEHYIAIARNPDGSVNDDATRLAFEILERFDKLPGYDSGFSQTDSIRSVSEALAKEGILYGGMALELVLDKGRLPYKFQPVSVTRLLFFNDDQTPSMGVKPVQNVGGTYIDLDIPTFFMVHIDPTLMDPYTQGPLEAAIQPVLGSATFLADMRRVLARHVYPRYDVQIDEEKLRASIPPEIAQDPEELPKFLDNVIASVKDTVNNMSVEEALVHYDFISISYVQNSDGAGDAEKFKIIKDIIDADLAKGAKVLPAVLGNGSGSQNVASTETMMFLLSANSMVRLKLQELYSKALTLAVRLFGQDVTVSFEFDPIELRPETELAAFRQMYMERIKQLWSYGLMGDMEASLRLTHKPVPPGFQTLSGTYFMSGGSPNGEVYIQDPANPTSGTSNGNTGSSGNPQDASSKARTPGTPGAPKGPAKKK